MTRTKTRSIDEENYDNQKFISPYWEQRYGHATEGRSGVKGGECRLVQIGRIRPVSGRNIVAEQKPDRTDIYYDYKWTFCASWNSQLIQFKVETLTRAKAAIYPPCPGVYIYEYLIISDEKFHPKKGEMAQVLKGRRGGGRSVIESKSD